MKILLIQPNFIKTDWPPLGLACIAANLRKERYDVKIIDTSFMRNLLELKDVLEDFGPQVVGLSFMSSISRYAFQVAELIRSVDPRICVVAGGPHPTIFPEDTISHYIHISVKGEGELVFLRILKIAAAAGSLKHAIRDNPDLEGIRGIVYRKDGEIVNTGFSQPIENLDLLPSPAYDLLPRQFFANRITSIIASRGCPSDCNFCQPTQRKLFGVKVKYEPIHKVLGMVERLLKDYSINRIHFVDDTFLINKDWVRQFCEQLIKNRLNKKIEFHFNVRANVLADAELFGLMRKANFTNAYLGAESGSQVILDEFRKRTKVEENISAVKLLKRFGFKVYMYLMLGAPSETQETLKATIEMVKITRPEDARVSLTSPLPGTDLEKYCIEKGIIIDNTDLYNKVYYESFDHFPIKLQVSREQILKAKRLIESISRKSRLSMELMAHPLIIWSKINRRFRVNLRNKFSFLTKILKYKIFFLLKIYIYAPVTFLKRVVFSRDIFWRQYFLNKWGFFSKSAIMKIKNKPVIWIDAASGGDVTEIVSLSRLIKNNLSEYKLIISTDNHYSFNFLMQNTAFADMIFITPWDIPVVVKRVLRNFYLKILIFIRMPYYPNLLRYAKRAGSINILGSAVMRDVLFNFSNTLVKRLFVYDAYKYIDQIIPNSKTDSESFINLRICPAEKLKLLGTLKFDTNFLKVSPDEISNFRKEMFLKDSDIVILAGSIHPKEDALIIESFDILKREIPQAKLILAPRFNSLIPSIEENLSKYGLSAVCRTELSNGDNDARDKVIIIDTFGELSKLYSLASVVVIGGSLFKRNNTGFGQNVVEPLLQAKPIFFGRYMYQWDYLTAELLSLWHGFKVNSAKELADNIVHFMHNVELKLALDELEAKIILENKDNAQRYVIFMKNLIGKDA